MERLYSKNDENEHPTLTKTQKKKQINQQTTKKGFASNSLPFDHICCY